MISQGDPLCKDLTPALSRVCEVLPAPRQGAKSVGGTYNGGPVILPAIPSLEYIRALFSLALVIANSQRDLTIINFLDLEGEKGIFWLFDKPKV